MTNRQFWIAKSGLTDTKWTDAPDAALAEGDVRLRLDAFALTANNVTYAAFGGEPMNYWAFFPAEDKAWGRVPVWGFAAVEASRADGVPAGARVYGYFPISTSLDVTPARVDSAGFMDAAAHRQGLAPIYNTYLFTDTDPAYDAAYEPQQMLFRPLYATGWWLADTLTLASDAPLRTVVMSSASSKTALALAHALKSRRDARAIGLTSARNRAFVEELDLYDEVRAYDEIEALTGEGPAAYVDFMGSPEITARVHAALGPTLARSLIVGATDWAGDKTPRPLEGPAPEFFFVPDVAAKRVKEAGPALMETMAADLRAFYPASGAFVTPEAASGEAAISKAWADMIAGRVAPSRGLILSL